MAVYNFKNVGKTYQDTQEESAAIVAQQTPFGVKTPLTLNTDTFFAVTYDFEDQVGDNLKNLIMTNWGERLGKYNFGANLRPLLADFRSQLAFDTEAVKRIKAATSRWMPYITLSEYVSETFPSFSNTMSQTSTEVKNITGIDITVTYTVPGIIEDLKSIRISLRVI